MGMSTKGMDIAAYFLRDKIYSNKILAVVREYICNAVDEHRKHQIDIAVEVRLEQDTDGKWYFTVRDRAMGLSDHGVRNIFGMYFESTKSGDNDSIGGFGIGSKAGMSYSDTFYITSWHEGVKAAYICSLGAGQKGVPVGEIYDISTEPTTESGIEIKIEVQSHEVNKFHNTAKGFVELFTNDIGLEFHSDYDKKTNGAPYVPHTPDFFVDLPGGYRLNRYLAEHASSYHGNSSVAIRMGGVIYTHRTLMPGSRDVTIEGYHVLDVPIGKLTIPISRENIEDTPGNTKVYEDITAQYLAIAEEDRKTLTTPKFGTIIEDKGNNSYYHARIAARWFNYGGNKAYPDTYRFANYIRRTSHAQIPREPNGNHVIYLLPDIKNQTNWQERLKRVLSVDPNYVGHFVATNDSMVQGFMQGSDSLDLSDVEFIDVKTLKLPSLPKQASGPQTEYLVYLNSYRQGTFTVESLDAHVEASRGFTADLDDKWWEHVESVKRLNARTIGLVNRYGTSCDFYTANSKKFVEAMVESGWLTPDAQEYKDTVIRIADEKAAKERIQNAEPSLRNAYFDTDFHPNIIKAVIRDINKIAKLKAVRDSILAEDTTRGRILRKLSRLGGYDGARKISREDLRRILTLK